MSDNIEFTVWEQGMSTVITTDYGEGRGMRIGPKLLPSEARPVATFELPASKLEDILLDREQLLRSLG